MGVRDKLLVTSGIRESGSSKQARAAQGWRVVCLEIPRSLFLFSSLVSTVTKPFSPLSRQASAGSLEGSHPVRLPNSQCVSAHIHHQLQRRVPVLGGLTPGAALIVHGAFLPVDFSRRLLQSPPQPTSKPSDPRPSRFLPTSSRLGRSLTNEHRPGARHFSAKVPEASFPVLPPGLGLSFRRPRQNLGFRGRAF